MAERGRWTFRVGSLAVGAGGAVAVAGLSLLLLTVVVTGLVYRHHVVLHPGPHLEREHIRAIIAQESPVFYRDGTTRMGVFFDGEHRQYLGWQELPLAWSAGIVAAEDQDFWSHRGISPRGIARAMWSNVRAGGLVAGGSTLTQQTAKNLYYRPDRSLRSKGMELLNALRLEAHYEKHELLTFYANQFHVTGNGRGLAIGARHFFDKEVEELSLVEAAFLAGMVKAPSWYDPFLGDEARRARSAERAHDRTRYVLRRIAETEASKLAGRPPRSVADPSEMRAWAGRLAAVEALRTEARELLDQGFSLDFRRGVFRFDSSAVLDEVARRLQEPPFREVLAQAGIDDPATAGLEVVTTLDPEAQRAAVYGLWHHLTEVGAWMEAPAPEDYLITDRRGPSWDPDMPLRRHDFRYARITEIKGEERRYFEVDLGGRTCVVDRDAVVRVAVAGVRGELGNSSAKAPTAAVDAFVDALPVDSVVWVSVREVPEEGPALCDLERRPELQGALTVLEGNQIRAMVGGNDNRNFNRVTALRQMGSTSKPLVFHAAMQLGWRPDEPLDNQRNVFPFSTTFYYPRPDHTPDPEVSMAWTGVRSENLASVWLLYHLIDHLDPAAVARLAETLDLARREGEAEADYRTRIQMAGVLPTPNRVAEALFLQSRHEVLARIDQMEHPEDRLALTSLLYGWGFDAERARVAREPVSTRAWKSRALDDSWRHLQPMLQPCEEQYHSLREALRFDRVPPAHEVPDLSVLLDESRIEVACGAIPEGYVRPDEEFLDSLFRGPDPAPLEEEAEEVEEPATRRRSLFGRRDRGAVRSAGIWPFVRAPLAPLQDLRIDDRLHLSTLRAVEEAVRRRELARDLAEELPGLYDPEILYWHQDFRVLLALRYFTSLAQRYGVQTPQQEVLSLPLGAGELTLEEATAVYGGLVTGQTWTFPGSTRRGAVASPPTATLLIAEIRDIDGRVLYRADPRPVEVTSVEVGHMSADIMRNTVRFGTGRRALAARLGGAMIPVGGKTGTTNDFRNAAFMGFVPRWGDEAFEIEAGYAVGAYVGYDDNRPMRKGRIRLAGASGALPAWLLTVNGLAEVGLLGQPEGEVGPDGAWPLAWSDSLVRVPVQDVQTGLPLEVFGLEEPLDPAGPGILAPRQIVQDVDLRQIHRPARVAPRTDAWEPAVEEPEDLWGRPVRVRPLP